MSLEDFLNSEHVKNFLLLKTLSNDDKETLRKTRKQAYDKSRRETYTEEYLKLRKASNKKYYSSVKGKAYLKLQNKRRYSTPEGAVASRIRAQINARLRGAVKAGFRNLPYSPQELKAHLEKLFLDGMSWENRSLWHIDHKIPLKARKRDGTYFWDQKEISDPSSETFQKAWSLDNLQPLWAKHNIKKGDKIE